MTHQEVYIVLAAVKAGQLNLTPEKAAEFWLELERIAEEETLYEVMLYVR